jgi:hypothetical protein
VDNLTCIIVAVVIVALISCCAVACLGGAFLLYGVQGTSAGAEQAEAIRSEVNVETPASVRVRNPVGDVTIQTGTESDRVAVQATKRSSSPVRRWTERALNEIEVAVVPEGSEVRVDVTLPETTGVRTARVDLTITVPEETDVDVVNEAGHIRIVGVEGSVRVRSETGALRMTDVTVEGEVDVMNTTGDITFEGRLPEPGSGEAWRVLLRTETGDVEFVVPLESQFTLDAESEVGTVDSKFELEGLQSGETRSEVGRWLKGGVNMEPGGGDVVLRTETGRIFVGPAE